MDIAILNIKRVSNFKTLSAPSPIVTGFSNSSYNAPIDNSTFIFGDGASITDKSWSLWYYNGYSYFDYDNYGNYDSSSAPIYYWNAFKCNITGQYTISWIVENYGLSYHTFNMCLYNITNTYNQTNCASATYNRACGLYPPNCLHTYSADINETISDQSNSHILKKVLNITDDNVLIFQGIDNNIDSSLTVSIYKGNVLSQL